MTFLFIQTLFVATIEAPVNCTEGDIRLYGGSKPNEGILHMCTNGAWGSVCNNGYWSNNDANVACYELGYTAYGIISSMYQSLKLLSLSVDNTYVNGRTDDKYPFIYTRFDCSGAESRLSYCSSSFTLNIQYCSNQKVVKLTCAGQYY